MSAEAELVYALFTMPNVFSPDGGLTRENLHNNNIFRSEDVSVVTIEITIFDRAGRKMHDVFGRYARLGRLGRTCYEFRQEGSRRGLLLGGFHADLFQETPR